MNTLYNILGKRNGIIYVKRLIIYKQIGRMVEEKFGGKYTMTSSTEKRKLRRRVFAEIAKMAYANEGAETLNNLPYRIVTGDDNPYRDTIFTERAIVGERLRVAMGMSLRGLNESASTADGVDASLTGERYYEPPLIDIIKFACNKCPENKVFITDGCQGCIEQRCLEVCPKKCITMKNGKSTIDEFACIKCGRCMTACQYHAIIRQERPCAKACGINAIREDEYGKAEIDQDKCVQCGMCLASCPFAAIVDKGQVYQTIRAMEEGEKVFAIVAPSIAGQFGKELTDTKMREAFDKLGFCDVVEVAIGADLCAVEEAEHFVKDVPSKLDFMITSCCPAWSILAKKMFPQMAQNVSMALTPMVLTARLIKRKYPDCKIAFIGPCLSKKNEASRRTVKSYVDFTLTYEELAGMFAAKEVDFSIIEEKEPLREASGDGYGFAKTGGVADAVAKQIKKIDPDRDVKIVRAEGLTDCMKLLKEASEGKYNGYLIEGMACPGGCIGGAGTLIPFNKANYHLNVAIDEATAPDPTENPYIEWLTTVENLHKTFEEARNEEE